MTSDRRVTMSVSLPAKLANKVEIAAKHVDLSLSAYIRIAVEDRLRQDGYLSAPSTGAR